MRIATYNVEWFHRLFDDKGRLLEDDQWSARHNITRAQQSQAIGYVMRRMDADGVMIIEAPDTHRGRDGVAALETFAARYGLRTRKAIMGFVSTTKQEIAFLYDPDILSVEHTPGDGAKAPRFDQQFTIPKSMEGAPEGIAEEVVTWSKPPLELSLVCQGKNLCVIGVHAKSKAAHGAQNAAQVAALSMANRRKQLAQCIWLRRRIDQRLEQGQSVIVLGDFNDGPGLDYYEKQLGGSSVEVVLGDAETALVEPHASMALAQRFGAMPTSARFYIADQKRFMQALLDYVMVSRDLAARTRWRIWHPFHDPSCWTDIRLRDALLTASDHFPVCADIAL